MVELEFDDEAADNPNDIAFCAQAGFAARKSAISDCALVR